MKQPSLNIFEWRQAHQQFMDNLPKVLCYYSDLFREGLIDSIDYRDITQAVMTAFLIDKVRLINMEKKYVRG